MNYFDKRIKELNEKIELEKAKPYVRAYVRERYSDWFGGKHRIYLSPGAETKNKIQQFLLQNGYLLTDYSRGLARKINDKRDTRIGRILNRLGNEELLKDFQEDDTRGMKTDNIVVISRHPYDIAGMSYDREWTSCMNIGRNTSQKKHVMCDIKEGTLVAYLVKASDKNIEKPIGRMLIKPFVGENGNVILFPERKVYGRGGDFLRSTVKQWLDTVQPNVPEGVYRIKPTLYRDSRTTVRVGVDGASSEKIEKAINLIMSTVEGDRHYRESEDYAGELFDMLVMESMRHGGARMQQFHPDYMMSDDMTDLMENVFGINPEDSMKKMIDITEKIKNDDHFIMEYIDNIYRQHGLDEYVQVKVIPVDEEMEAQIDFYYQDEIDEEFIEENIDEIKEIVEENGIYFHENAGFDLVYHHMEGHFFYGIRNDHFIEFLEEHYNRMGFASFEIKEWAEQHGYDTGYSNYLKVDKFISDEDIGMIGSYIRDEGIEELPDEDPALLLKKAGEYYDDEDTIELADKLIKTIGKKQKRLKESIRAKLRGILSEGPYDSPNQEHVKTIHDKDFLHLLRHKILARLFNGLIEFFHEDPEYCSFLQDCLKDYAKSIKLIGGFLTKFAKKDSDIDINVLLTDEILKRVDDNKEEAISKIHNFFRSNINDKPLGDGYDYVINYFFTRSSDVDFKRHGIQMYGDEIKKKEVEDEMDKRMVDVCQYLQEEKFEKYIFIPMKKAMNIIKDMMRRKKLDRIDELMDTYDIRERVGGEVFKEFKNFSKDLTIYHYTADNLRFKAMREHSDFHDFMALASRDDDTKLKQFVKNKNWNVNLDFIKSITPQIVKKVLDKDPNAMRSYM